MMKSFLSNSYLFGGNAPFVEELYEQYLENPGKVSEEWRVYFDKLQQSGGDGARDVPHLPIQEAFVQLTKKPRFVAGLPTGGGDKKQVAVLKLIAAYRTLGVRVANLDPLKRLDQMVVPELDPGYHGLSDADMATVLDTGMFVGLERAPLSQIISALRETYCGNLGIEYMHITDSAKKRWIQEYFEGRRSKPGFTPAKKKRILKQITAAETLEKYLHTKYVGQKRFSLEGGDSLIAAMDELIQRSGELGVQEMVIGMAHRGRLNVLVNTLGKEPKTLFAEFEGKAGSDLSSGDVKYHNGFSADITTPKDPIHVSLAFNPSHLEIVDPVVEGSVRARQQRRHDMTGDQVVPVLIHGDAAFAGQGVVVETLNLSQTRGYGTGGTVHIVVNNQVGFTTSDTRDTRSTLYCTDVVKMIEAPIFHVNGDDPEAVVLAVQAALDYRMKFKMDAVIDLVCFRRHGHNEADDPMLTQPMMYKKISKHPGTRKLYADRLLAEGVVKAEEPDALIKAYRAALDAGTHVEQTALTNYNRKFAIDYAPYAGIHWAHPVTTAVALDDLKRLALKVTAVPEGFKINPNLERGTIEPRRKMGRGELPLDFGMAEMLAYASLVSEGYGVRISGQDCGRGTFSHRHAVLHDQNRERWDAGAYTPLQHLNDKQAHFLVIDSLLSEEAVLGFEYGYSCAEPNELVIWEAQFGDFANGAQVVIDQFITSGETKWGRYCGLVMLLPHGYDGQGPEHSSCRVERYLQMCAEHNIQVVMPSTAAQMFHMLRRQMLRPYRKPLIVPMSKRLLKFKEAQSDLSELASGSFQPVIGESDDIDPKKVKRVIACSGQVYYDLRAARREREIKDIAIIRLEQIYPFPTEQFTHEVQKYTGAKELVWVQEEPRNQGMWHQIRHRLEGVLSPKQTLAYAGRPSSASPAVGYMSKHTAQLKAFLDEAMTLKK